MGRSLDKLDALLASLLPSATIATLRAAAAALRFHLAAPRHRRPIVVLLGGTGTGKSTLVNRLFGASLTATDIRRTFTAGAIAVTKDDLPAGWLELPHIPADSLPARGQPDRLYVVRHSHPLTDAATIVDTPDLDGDRPEHHAQADRAFRWADAVLFVVTPEKYQMTELLPYYRLATRYAVPAAFIMNKCQDAETLEDYRRLLAARDWPDGQLKLFAVPRDDAAFEPRPEENLLALASTLRSLPPPAPDPRGLTNRATDLALRVQDQLVEPMRRQRAAADALARSLRAMETPAPGLDVSPVTRQLQQRLQERSILYLMGPQRILDRARQLPSMLVRLPREILTGAKSPAATPPPAKEQPPDFPALLADQFSLLHTRIEDLLRSDPTAAAWLDATYESTKIPPSDAATIGTEELASLKSWLEQRWNTDPRDTKLALRVLRHLPGGRTLTRWSEAAPYLLAVVVATHHAFFGHVDLMIMGSYSLLVWMTQRLSDEVSARSRAANANIARRFTELAHDQIDRAIAWINARVPASATIEKLQSLAESLPAETES